MRRASSRALWACPLDRIVHGLTIEGWTWRRPRNIERGMPSTPASSVAAPARCTPLAPLSGDEIKAAREIVFASGRAEVPTEALRFAYLGLCDPPKDLVRAFDRRRERAGGPLRSASCCSRAPWTTSPRSSCR